MRSRPQSHPLPTEGSRGYEKACEESTSEEGITEEGNQEVVYEEELHEEEVNTKGFCWAARKPPGESYSREDD